MSERRRFKQTAPLDERLAAEAARLREEASKLPYGGQRDALLRRARQAETAARVVDWVASPGLQPPT